MLSILIPSIPKRWNTLEKLIKNLSKQLTQLRSHEMLGDIEFIVDAGESFLDGGLSIGKKRESLVKQAKGRYLCFLDDDDTVPFNYCESLLRMCNEGMHVCTFRALIKLHDSWGLVNMTLENKENEQYTPDRIIQRPPWHMCPVWSEFAKLYPFPDKNNAEDFEWFEKVLSHCETETHTDKILFQYNHGEHSEADRITNLKK